MTGADVTLGGNLAYRLERALEDLAPNTIPSVSPTPSGPPLVAVVIPALKVAGRQMSSWVPSPTQNRFLAARADWCQAGGRWIAARGEEPPKLMLRGASGER